MSADALLLTGFGILIALFVFLIAVSVPRGRRMQQTNERIAANQEKILALHERQTAALERIAISLEKR